LASEPYGSFTGAFEGTITFEWAPDPLIVAQEIETVARELDDMMAPLQAARQIAAQDIDKRFDTKTDPDGGAWAPWSAEYAARPPLGTLLEATGAMRAAAGSPSAFSVTAHAGGGEVFFTGAGVPEYWIFHQLGATRHSHSKETIAFLEESGGEYIPNTLPARPFVGLSEEAEVLIVDVFDEWLGGVINLAVHPTTGFVQARGPGGQFGRRIGF
jgi:phage gpG-like protein